MKVQWGLIITFTWLSTVSFISPTIASENVPTITLNDSNKEPFTTKARDGFLDIILTEAFRRIGYKLNTVQLPPERGLLAANEGIVDGDVNRIKGLEKTYPNLQRVPEKIRDSEFCALSKNNSISNTPNELKKRVVGHIKGWKIYDKMMATSKKVITASSPTQLFRLLEVNRIEVALYSCVEGLDLAQRLGINNIHILKPDFQQVKLFIYLNNKHANLIPQLSSALLLIKNEGLYDSVYQKKIFPYYEQLNK